MNRFSEKAKHLDSYQSIVDIFKFFYDKKNQTYQMENEILRANTYLLPKNNLLQAYDSVFQFMSNNEIIINFEP